MTWQPLNQDIFLTKQTFPVRLEILEKYKFSTAWIHQWASTTCQPPISVHLLGATCTCVSTVTSPLASHFTTTHLHQMGIKAWAGLWRLLYLGRAPLKVEDGLRK